MQMPHICCQCEGSYFFVFLKYIAALGPGVHRASNRNEYQKKMFQGGKLRPVREAENLSAVSRLSKQCGILNIKQPYRPPWPVTGIALLYGDGVCFL
jgi:hypothetical protein